MGAYAGRNGEVAIDGDEIMRLVNAFTVLSPENSTIFAVYRENILGKRKNNLSGPVCLYRELCSGRIDRIYPRAGGVLVLDDLCIGRRMLQFPPEEPDEADGDPYSYLARLYLGKDPARVCNRLMKNLKK